MHYSREEIPSASCPCEARAPPSCLAHGPCQEEDGVPKVDGSGHKVAHKVLRHLAQGRR